MSDIISTLPDVLATEDLIVSDESHEYEAVEYDDGTVTERTQYVPDKAPVIEIRSVDGVVDGREYRFVAGTDYSVLDTDNDGLLDTIEFDVGGESPDPGSEFTITYQCDSILSRYIGSYGTELHTIESDINRVIDSHYVDQASQCQPIDSFEDQQLVEYTFDQGGTPNATIQSDVVFDGNWALELNSACADELVRIASRNGLTVYPQRGDYFIYHVRLENDADISQFDFLYQNGDGSDSFYRIAIDAGSNDVTLSAEPDGSMDSTAIGLSDVTGTWFRVDVTVSNTGPIDVTLVNTETGSEVASVSISDTEYEAGGIRWAATNPNCQSEVYIDMARVIDRQTDDLDQIGALFGELGRRRGRDDEEYVDFLKSIVGSFSGRGTTSGIRDAVSNLLGISTDQITIGEDFINNEYRIEIENWPANRTRSINTVAELADPSGVSLETVAFRIDKDILQVVDTEFDRVTATNTSALRYDSSLFDNFEYDSSTPGDATEIVDDALLNVDASTAKLDRYDQVGYDSFEWSGRSGTEVSESSDFVEERIDADAQLAEPDVITSVALRLTAITQLIDDTSQDSVTIGASIDSTVAESNTTTATESDLITATTGTDSAQTTDSIQTDVTFVTIWEETTWDDSNWA